MFFLLLKCVEQLSQDVKNYLQALEISYVYDSKESGKEFKKEIFKLFEIHHT